MPPDPAPHAAKPRTASGAASRAAAALRIRAAVVMALVTLPVAARAAAPTFSVDYVVAIRRGDPGHARVRWLLAGIDEVASFRLVFRDGRTTRVTGSGTLVWHDRTLLWTPGGPYAHLAYTVAIDRPRPPGAHFDSHADRDWVATRALHFFPEINMSFRPGTVRAMSRARLVFRLPCGWRVAAAAPRLADDTFAVEEPAKRLDRPRGWFLLGRIARHTRVIAGLPVTIAVAPGSALDPRRLLRLYVRTAPLLESILRPPPPRRAQQQRPSDHVVDRPGDATRDRWAADARRRRTRARERARAPLDGELSARRQSDGRPRLHPALPASRLPGRVSAAGHHIGRELIDRIAGRAHNEIRACAPRVWSSCPIARPSRWCAARRACMRSARWAVSRRPSTTRCEPTTAPGSHGSGSMRPTTSAPRPRGSPTRSAPPG